MTTQKEPREIMKNLKQLIKEFRELKELSFIKGKLRYDKDCDLVCDGSVKDYRKIIASSSGEVVIMDEDAAFFCYSANNITKLLDAVEVLVEAAHDVVGAELRTFGRLRADTLISESVFNLNKAIQQVDEKVGK